jgi:hypothetical protein
MFFNTITAFTGSYCFSIVKSFRAKEMYLHGARSGFKHELTIHFRTLTRNSGNKTLVNLIPILDELAKLQSWSVYFVMSVFLMATTAIEGGELS